jgi:putative flippase GtrA
MVIHPYYQGPFYARIDKRLLFEYMLAGAVTTFSDYAVFTLFFTVWNAGLLVATILAYIVGLVVSFLFNRYVVFKKGADRQSAATSLWRYGTFLLVNLGITYLILWFLEVNFGINPYIGKLIVGAFMFFWIYMGDKVWVFHGERTGPIQL